MGFVDVDAAVEPDRIVEGMDVGGTRHEVLRLRAWEAAQLRLRPGQSVIDVGCGSGTAAIAAGGSAAMCIPHR